MADRLQQDFSPDDENLDYLFTPKRFTQIDRAIAQVQAGDVYRAEQVRAQFEQKRQA